MSYDCEENRIVKRRSSNIRTKSCLNDCFTQFLMPQEILTKGVSKLVGYKPKKLLVTPSGVSYRVNPKQFGRLLKDLERIVCEQKKLGGLSGGTATYDKQEEKVRELKGLFSTDYWHVLDYLYTVYRPGPFSKKYLFFNPRFFSARDRHYFWRFVDLMAACHATSHGFPDLQRLKQGRTFGARTHGLNENRILRICELKAKGVKVKEIVKILGGDFAIIDLESAKKQVHRIWKRHGLEYLKSHPFNGSTREK